MDAILSLLNRIQAPLQFASCDGYQRLPLVKNMERSMNSLLDKCREGSKLLVIPAYRDEVAAIIVQLDDLFKGFDALPLERKKEHIAQAVLHVQRISGLISIALRESKLSGQILKAPAGEEILRRSLETIRGVGPRLMALLSRKNLSTIEDLLYFLPRGYEDRRVVCRISETVPGIRQTITGKISASEMRCYGKRKIFEATVDDGRDTLKAKWFKGREAFLRGAITPGKRIILTGKISAFPFEKEMLHPDFEILDDHEDQLLNFKRIVPVYSETEGLPQKTLRRILWQAVRDYGPLLPSLIPESLCRKRGLMEIGEAVRQVHFPGQEQDISHYREMRSEAHRRMIYDECFFFQLGMALRRQEERFQKGISFRPGGNLLQRFYDSLPFALTAAQQRVIGEIEKDMTSARCMNRLLQGDVGSGKTAVAMAAMVIACESGYQAALMAPTEILAEQHYRNLGTWSKRVGLRIELLTGGCRSLPKEEFASCLVDGKIDIAIGTHALIQEGISFCNLGMAIIDEQHRFGVIQRAALRNKGTMPDVLVMTATPIPRTLAMTAYGDLDVSVIDEMPPGKIPVRTKIFLETQRSRVYEVIGRELKKGNQVFIVYPLVEETENLSLKDAKGMAEHLRKEVFPDYPVGLIHGRMKPEEKNRVMADFAGHRTRILVSTTVIEVGIDVPAASLMVIEHAERFGLSQLHQLRGRVGRGSAPSCCILMTQPERSDEARKRLRMMEHTTDGFQIAEADLAIRGPGEFLGTRQSGLPDFRVANIARDIQLLSEAREDAFAIIDADPGLERSEHIQLRKGLQKKWEGKLALAKIG